ncbi:MAG: DUF4386 domain-containing protein [Actinomycetales bacterium]
MSTHTDTAPRAASGSGTPARGMDWARKVALAGGVLYLVTFAASIPQLKLFADLVNDPVAFINGAGSLTPVRVGLWLELVTAASTIGTAVALYPITRRVSRTAAIGYVTSRVVEGALIAVGVVALLAAITLRGELAGATGAQADALNVTGQALVSLRQWTFLVGPGVIPGINALFLGYVMYKSGLVPRLIPTVGLIGAPLILISATATIFGVWDQTSSLGALFAFPIAAWELSVGLWMTVKGFRPAAVAALEDVVATAT